MVRPMVSRVVAALPAGGVSPAYASGDGVGWRATLSAVFGGRVTRGAHDALAAEPCCGSRDCRPIDSTRSPYSAAARRVAPCACTSFVLLCVYCDCLGSQLAVMVSSVRRLYAVECSGMSVRLLRARVTL